MPKHLLEILNRGHSFGKRKEDWSTLKEIQRMETSSIFHEGIKETSLLYIDLRHISFQACYPHRFSETFTARQHFLLIANAAGAVADTPHKKKRNY